MGNAEGLYSIFWFLQVRVVQNKEPEHFLRIFRGRLIILDVSIDLKH